MQSYYATSSCVYSHLMRNYFYLSVNLSNGSASDDKANAIPGNYRHNLWWVLLVVHMIKFIEHRKYFFQLARNYITSGADITKN